MQIKKRIHELKQGDIVKYNGARFRVLFDAKESQGHRPQSDHLTTAHGPCDVAYTVGEWVSGQVIPCYYGPNDPWTFQGNFNAWHYDVEITS